MEKKSLLRKRFLYKEKYDKPKYFWTFLIGFWIIAIVMYFLDIIGPKGNSYIWIAIAVGATIGSFLSREIRNKKKKLLNH
jgi:hypothetical protein